MKYKLSITEEAELAISDYADFIVKNGYPEAAHRWVKEIWEVVASLEELPYRFQAIGDEFGLNTSTRSVVVHSHRIIFRVDEELKCVYVLAIIHATLDVDLTKFTQ